MTLFAGYYRDAVGQDYAMARYYNATTGAFWSQDPGSISTADATNPLSWNRYAYAIGDPVNLGDPTGRIACDPEEDEGCAADPSDGCDGDSCSCADDTACDDGGGGGGGCPVDTCVTVTASADPVPTIGDDGDDDADDGDDETQTTFSTTVTSTQVTNCVSASIAAGSLIGAGAGWLVGGGVGVAGGGTAGSVIPGFGTIWGVFTGGALGSEGGALVGASVGGAVGGVVGNVFCNWIGPSGKPKIHVVHHPSKKRAKDAARNGGSGAPIHHPSPRKGPPHFHPTDPNGGKIHGVHHAYPW